MSFGTGKYDKECERLLVKTGASACVVVVLGGRKGSGTSVSTRVGGRVNGMPITTDLLAGALEHVAKDVRNNT